MTKRALEKLNVTQRARIDVYREMYREAKTFEEKAMARAKSRAYTNALLDSDILTKKEADAILIFTTV